MRACGFANTAGIGFARSFNPMLPHFGDLVEAVHHDFLGIFGAKKTSCFLRMKDSCIEGQDSSNWQTAESDVCFISESEISRKKIAHRSPAVYFFWSFLVRVGIRLRNTINEGVWYNCITPLRVKAICSGINTQNHLLEKCHSCSFLLTVFTGLDVTSDTNWTWDFMPFNWAGPGTHPRNWRANETSKPFSPEE